jgi:hypothetical protein
MTGSDVFDGEYVLLAAASLVATARPASSTARNGARRVIGVLAE